MTGNKSSDLATNGDRYLIVTNSIWDLGDPVEDVNSIDDTGY